MNTRNDVAHKVTAASTYEAFSFAEDTEADLKIYRLLFHRFFGFEMKDYKEVSQEKREKTLENCK